MKQVIVTGGEGFIGRYVKSRLEELDIPSYSFDAVNGQDVTDRQLIWETWNPDTTRAVIHLAGKLGTHELWDDSDQAIDVNIKGGLNVGKWCAAHGIKMVSIEQPHIWYNVYEATKFALKRMLIGLAYQDQLKVEFVTAHNAYGPGQHHGPGHPRKIIPYFATQAWAGEPIEIWGDGDQEVNLVYAGDVADMLVKRAIQPNVWHLREFNAGVNVLESVKYVAKYVRAYTNSESEIVYNMDGRRGEQTGKGFGYPQPDDTYPYKFAPEMLDATIDWYRP